jgi:D-alanine-D-alanine ligase
MKIGLTYDLQTDPADERQAEFDPPRTIEALTAALASLGHAVVPIGNSGRLQTWLGAGEAVDLVFNIAEGRLGRCRESVVPALLEQASLPYVGSAPAALALGLDKLMTKRLAIAQGLRTPCWLSIQPSDHLPAELPVPFSVIVKPRWEGSGIGIDEDAVVHDRQSLMRRAHMIWSRWPEPLLVEEFIDGGELTVLVIGNDPPTAYPPIQRPIDVRTRLACHVLRGPSIGWEAPLILTEALDAQARQAALAVFEAVGCRDMARVDFRVDGQERLWFLEINPLPSLDPDGTFGLLAEAMGMTYAQLIGRVLDAAITRNNQSPNSPGPPRALAGAGKIQINSNHQ